MKRERRNYSDVKNYVESFGHKLLSLEKDIVDSKGNVQAKTKLLIECEKGHRFNTIFDVYKRGKHKCKQCFQESGQARRKYNYDYIVKVLKEEGYIVLSPKEDYKNLETVLNTKCPNGHNWSVSFHNYKAGYRCPICKKEEKERHELKDIENILETSGYTILDFERSDSFFTESIFTIRCENGHISKKAIKSVRANKLACLECIGKKKKTLEEAIELFNSYGYEVVSHNGYENSQSRFILSCKEGHKFETTYSNFKRGDRLCPICKQDESSSISKGEKEIIRVLEKLNIDYLFQYTREDCKLKSQLPFDFYLPKLNAIIEYDGIQHYEPVKYFGGMNKFISQKITDTIKNRYCKDNGIHLIRIPYWEFDNIETILKNKIYEASSTTRF